jgi:2,3-bisphosphoglycerate-independent phosphoglycerate mutase
MIIGDGMADRPLKQLGYRTPLEAAKPASMDKLASMGMSGLLDPVAVGVAPGTETACLTLLGYDAKSILGRGPFEAAGCGIKLKQDDVAFRCNLATVNEDLKMMDERAGRIGQETQALAEAVKTFTPKKASNVHVIYEQSSGFKGALVLRGQGLSPHVSAALPKKGESLLPVKPLDASPEAARTAEVLNEFVQESHRLLREHPVNVKRMAEGRLPANIIVPWGGAKTPQLKPFTEKYKLRAACVAGVSIVKGIANLSGMSVLNVKGATGGLDTDTLAKAEAALNAAKTHDFVLVHVEGPDEASHDGDVRGKIAIIKKVDAMVGVIMKNVDLDDTVLVLLADHATSCMLRQHTGDPVPIAVASNALVKDGITRYSESAACHGGFSRLLGSHIMPIILNLIGKPERTGS